MNYPLVAVVIACFNQIRELELTLESFLRQSFPFHEYELIVVDDHSSTCASREIVARMRNKYPAAMLHYVRQYRPDGGKYGSSARAKNLGLRLAQGQYVLFNNAEIVHAGQSLSYMAGVMTSSAEPLCLRGVVMDLPYEDLVDRTPVELEQIHDQTDRARERVATADHAGLAVVPRSLLLSVGGIDERFDYWGKEDLDLANRLKRAGARYVYDPKFKSFHISHPPNHAKAGDYERMIALLDQNNAAQAIEVNRGCLWGRLTLPPLEQLDGTVIVEANEDLDDLEHRLKSVLYSGGAERREVLVVCEASRRPVVESFLLKRYRPVTLLSIPSEAAHDFTSCVLSRLRTSCFAFLPAGTPFDRPRWQSVSNNPPFPIAMPRCCLQGNSATSVASVNP